jgi:hypothetical protein
MTRPTILLLLRLFIAAGTFFTEPFSSLCLATTGRIHIQTHTLMGGIY